jgi:hypothetical protein
LQAFTEAHGELEGEGIAINIKNLDALIFVVALGGYFMGGLVKSSADC